MEEWISGFFETKSSRFLKFGFERLCILPVFGPFSRDIASKQQELR
jgi:hypothetical protein